MCEKKIHFELKTLKENLKNFEELISECENQSEEIFQMLKESCLILKVKVEKIANFASIYDFSEIKPGNGFWSFVKISEKAAEYAKKVCMKYRERWKCLKENLRSIETSIHLLDNLNRIAEMLIKNHEDSENKHRKEGIKGPPINLNISCFYDSPLGFHFTKSLQPFLRYINGLLCASFDVQQANCCRLFQEYFWFFIKAIKYFRNDELRANKILEITLKGDAKFLKNFWSIVDLKVWLLFVKSLAPSVAVDYTFKIEPKPLKLNSIDVPIPLSHIGHKAIKCRLISSKLREGMVTGCCKKIHNPSKCLMVHLHGGAFIATSSKSAVSYLRELASTLDIPIVSIDYTLALEAPYPRAVEEIFYAYCWILINFSQLGTTGEKIIFFGDSAGANLAAECIVRCIEKNVPVPSSFISFDGCFCFEMETCPSSFMSYLDPLLICNLLLKISEVYLKDDKGRFYSLPTSVPDEILKKFPKTYLISSINDPLLDGSVNFAKKLTALGVETELEIFDALCHGFLFFIHFSRDCKDAFDYVVKKIANLIKD